MRVVVSGSTGLIGSSLTDRLRSAGHKVLTLHRFVPTSGDRLRWDPSSGAIDWGTHCGTQVDAVIHLAGENIGANRWSAARKVEFRLSRVEATRSLVKTLLELPQPPSMFIGASAIGYYGDHGDNWIEEHQASGSDFISKLALDWEQATLPLKAVACRVVHARFGMVLSMNGGAFAKMLTPFRWGLGAQLGSGQQWMSWISLEDCTAALLHALIAPKLAGGVNFVSPAPLRNTNFTQALARLLHRPALCRVPAGLLRIVFGEMADALLLRSQRVAPTQLNASGFRFADPTFEPMLVRLLNNRSPNSVRNRR